MTHSKSKIVRIAEPKGQSNLSKAQKSFNKLIKKIDAQRQALEAWQAAIPLYQQRYASEFDPLLRTFDEHRAKLVRLFDAAYSDKALTKTDKAKIKETTEWAFMAEPEVKWMIPCDGRALLPGGCEGRVRMGRSADPRIPPKCFWNDANALAAGRVRCVEA